MNLFKLIKNLAIKSENFSWKIFQKKIGNEMEMDSKRRWEPGNNKIENKQRKMMGGEEKMAAG